MIGREFGKYLSFRRVRRGGGEGKLRNNTCSTTTCRFSPLNFTPPIHPGCGLGVSDLRIYVFIYFYVKMEEASWWPDVLRPAPPSRYADIFSSFLRSSSFPAFVAYLAAANLLPRYLKSKKKFASMFCASLVFFFPFPDGGRGTSPPLRAGPSRSSWWHTTSSSAWYVLGEIFFYVWKQLQFHIFENKPD